MRFFIRVAPVAAAAVLLDIMCHRRESDVGE